MTSKVITTRTRNIRKDVTTKSFDEIMAEFEDGISHLTLFGQDDLKPAPKPFTKSPESCDYTSEFGIFCAEAGID
jgi:hypothetical protein